MGSRGRATPVVALGVGEMGADWDDLSSAWVGRPIPEGWAPGGAELPLLVLEFPMMPGRRRHAEASRPLRASLLVLEVGWSRPDERGWLTGWLGRNVRAPLVVLDIGGERAEAMAAAVGGEKVSDLEAADRGHARAISELGRLEAARRARRVGRPGDMAAAVYR